MCKCIESHIAAYEITSDPLLLRDNTDEDALLIRSPCQPTSQLNPFPSRSRHAWERRNLIKCYSERRTTIWADT